MIKENLELEDFIENPTNLSKHFLKIIIIKKRKYDSMFGSKNFIGKLISGVKLRLWYLNKYQEIYYFIKTFEIKTTVKELFNEFSRISDFINLNNLLLMYSYLTEKDQYSPIITKEDEKLLYLNKLYHGKISIKEFKEKFGHYALNAFELSSKRFSEYDHKELMDLAKLLKNFKLKKRIELEDYIKGKNKSLFPIYSAMREELKYIALQVVSELRVELLELAKKENIENIFDLSYNKLKEYV